MQAIFNGLHENKNPGDVTLALLLCVCEMVVGKLREKSQ